MESRPGGLFLLSKPCFINLHRRPLPSWKFTNPNFYSFYILPGSFISRIRNSRWDSNAEPVGSKRFKFKFREKDKKDTGNDGLEVANEEEGGGGYTEEGKERRWWSDEPPAAEEDEVEPGILEEAIESLWIFKVTKSYGWILPPFLLTLLLVNGAKALLMALALPLGLSVLTFAFEKLSGKKQRKPKRKARKRRKPAASPPSDAEVDDGEETGKGEMGYQSWVVNDNGAVSKDNQGRPRFGGWEELDGRVSTQRPRRMAGQSRRRRPLRNGKLGKRGKTGDMPLLLRLLIAFFPFLGSWTRML